MLVSGLVDFLMLFQSEILMEVVSNVPSWDCRMSLWSKQNVLRRLYFILKNKQKNPPLTQCSGYPKPSRARENNGPCVPVRSV